jgi:hypothetical protein
MKPSILATVLTKQLDNLKIPKWKSVNDYVFLSEVEKMENEETLKLNNGILIFDDEYGWAKIFYETEYAIRNIAENLKKSGWKFCSNRAELN